MATRQYYPITTDKAWQLAERFITNKPQQYKKILLLVMAKKYKDTPNADFLRFYDDGVLLIENVPSIGNESNSDESNSFIAVQVAYFMRDLMSDEIYFPQTLDEARTLVKQLLSKELIEKAIDCSGE